VQKFQRMVRSKDANGKRINRLNKHKKDKNHNSAGTLCHKKPVVKDQNSPEIAQQVSKPCGNTQSTVAERREGEEHIRSAARVKLHDAGLEE